jgi:hypothetical protein
MSLEPRVNMKLGTESSDMTDDIEKGLVSAFFEDFLKVEASMRQHRN